MPLSLMPQPTPSPVVDQAQSSAIAPAMYGAEVDQFHTRLLRVSLAEEESRAYWAQLKTPVPKENRAAIAFEERWFGNKSMDRVKRLLSEFRHRYDAYPTALNVLCAWQPSDPITRQNICHWHMQLTDPTYRNFTGSFLEQRRLQTKAEIDRDIIARWVALQLPTEWSTTTIQRMATGLLASAKAAGLCSDNVGSRSLQYPKVTDEALVYWLYFLRGMSFKGTILENSYFASVGLSEGFLEQRLRRVEGLSFNRMGDLHDFTWQYPNLLAWASQELELIWESDQ